MNNMNNKLGDLFEQRIDELRCCLNRHLDSADIFVLVDTTDVPIGLSDDKARFLNKCRAFYSQMKSNLMDNDVSGVKVHALQTDSSYGFMLKTRGGLQKILPIETLNFKQLVERFQSDLQQDGSKPDRQQVLGDWFRGIFSSKMRKTVDSVLKNLSLSTEKSWAAQTNEDIESYQLLLSSIKRNDIYSIQSLFVKDSQIGLRFIEIRGYYVWMIAINQGNLAIIQLLLDKAHFPETQLIWALECALERGDSDVIELIIKQCENNRERYIELVFKRNKQSFKIDWCRLENIPYQYDIDIEKVHELTNPNTRASLYFSVSKRMRRFRYVRGVESYTEPRILRITHSGLIECGQRLGYSLNENGICHGYIIRWIEATILGQQTRFLNRLYKINSLNYLFNRQDTLERLEQQPEWKKILWEIKAFYETLHLYQSPYIFCSIFNQCVSQNDIELISQIASSDEIMRLGAIKRSPILRYDEFSLRGLMATLKQLEQAVKDSRYNDVVCFLLSCEGALFSHSITAIYDPRKEAWQWVDINLPIINSRTLVGLIDAIKNVYLTSTDKAYLDPYHSFCISAVLPSATVNCLEPYLINITKFEDAPSLVMSQSFLFIASYEGDIHGVTSLLTKNGINPNQVMKNSATPLFIAAQNGYWEIVNALLAHPDINPNQAMNNHATPLFIAAQEGNLKIVKALLACPDINPNHATINGATPLFIAAQNGHLEVVKALLARTDSNLNQAMTDGETPLFIAAQKGHLEVVKALLARTDSNLNQAMTDGETPLFIAAQNGYLEIVKALLACDGINLNQAVSNGATPLFMAAQQGHLEVVKALLARDGINPNQAMSNGATPLFIAAQEGKDTIVEYLLQQGVARDIPIRASEASLTQFAMNQTTGDCDLKNRMQKMIRDYQEKNPSAEQIAITPEQIADVMGHVAVKRLFTNYCNAGVDTSVFAYGRMRS